MLSLIAPASKREISRRSSTRPWNRMTSLDSRSSADCARSGRSSRRASITSTDAARVISGDRSSWLTSDAKRASRSTRCSSASAMSLNDSVSTRRSGSSVNSNRVSRRPPAIAEAAWAAVPSGRTARRAEKIPTSTPSPVVISAARNNATRRFERLESTSSSGKNSKYAPTWGTDHPTTMFSSSSMRTICRDGVPSTTTCSNRSGGMLSRVYGGVPYWLSRYQIM